uniref:Uncharacterized protein n=1 Tax=Anser cygnoides TaxID=8845 RepID=A0A8B9IJU7_ANSCY
SVVFAVRGPKLNTVCAKMVKFHMPVEFQFNIPMRVYFFFSLQINIENADKVSKINKAFTEIQKEVQQLSKGPVVEPQKNNQVISVCKNLRREN